MSKKIKILLGVSLMLNLLFIGLAGGMAWKFKGFMRHDNKPQYIAQKLVQDLPAERQKVLLKDFADLGRDKNTEKGLKRSGWRNVVEAVEAEPFDGTVVREALTNLHQKHSARKQLVGERFITMLETMSVKEREIVRKGCMFQKMKKGRGRYRQH